MTHAHSFRRPTADGDAPRNYQKLSSSEKDDYYLRMLMDIVRVSHQQEETPLEFVCPLTTQIMLDPVVLHETGHSYEVRPIETQEGC